MSNGSLTNLRASGKGRKVERRNKGKEEKNDPQKDAVLLFNSSNHRGGIESMMIPQRLILRGTPKIHLKD